MNGVGAISLSIIIFVIYLAATGRLLRVVSIVKGSAPTDQSFLSQLGGMIGKPLSNALPNPTGPGK